MAYVESLQAIQKKNMNLWTTRFGFIALYHIDFSPKNS